MKRRIVNGCFCCIVCVISGCGMASSVSNPLPLADKVHRANKEANEIEIYRQGNLPAKGFIHIANIGAHGNGYANFDTCEAAIRKEAAKIGAELVVLTKYEVSSDETFGSYGGGMFMANQIKRPHLYGVAGVYSRVSMGVVVENDGKIKYVSADTPADKAGLKEGMQILSINGVYFHNASILQEEIGTKKPGDSISIEYLDNAKNKGKVTLTLIANE